MRDEAELSLLLASDTEAARCRGKQGVTARWAGSRRAEPNGQPPRSPPPRAFVEDAGAALAAPFATPIRVDAPRTKRVPIAFDQ